MEMNMNKMYKCTIEIAKIDDAKSGNILRPRLGTGGEFADLFLWDTAFTAMWGKYHMDELPVERSLDNFYKLQDDDGFISRQYLNTGESKWSKEHPISFAPPILSWAEIDIYKISGNKNRLAKVYPHLKKHHNFCMNNFRTDNGLFFSDHYGCGMDNLPRMPYDLIDDKTGILLERHHIHRSVDDNYAMQLMSSPYFRWNIQGSWIDTSAQMAFNALCLKKIAEILGINKDIVIFKKEHKNIANKINEKCWNNEHQFYFDLAFGKQVPRFHIGSFWTLIAQVVPKERLTGYVAHLEDKNKFNRTVPIPTLAADDPDYNKNGGYWRGSVWAPTNYMVLHGLKENGFDDLAKSIAQKYYNAVSKVFEDTGTLWENYSPEKAAPGNLSQRDFCGWTGLASVAVYNEFI